MITKEADLTDIFSEYESILEVIDATAEDAYNRMLETQQDAVTNYSIEYLPQLFHNNLVAHAKKYAELTIMYAQDLNPFDAVNLHETYSSERTPELTTSSSSTGSGSSDTQRKQSMTTTSSPGVTTTSNHSVNPYDNTGLRQETQDTMTESGSNTTTQSFSGQPDHVATTSTANTIMNQSGSDTLETDRITVGRNGRRFTLAELTDSALYTLDKIDILDIIINDLASEIFLQVWIF